MLLLLNFSAINSSLTLSIHDVFIFILVWKMKFWILSFQRIWTPWLVNIPIIQWVLMHFFNFDLFKYPIFDMLCDLVHFDLICSPLMFGYIFSTWRLLSNTIFSLKLLHGLRIYIEVILWYSFLRWLLVDFIRKNLLNVLRNYLIDS